MAVRAIQRAELHPPLAESEAAILAQEALHQRPWELEVATSRWKESLVGNAAPVNLGEAVAAIVMATSHLDNIAIVVALRATSAVSVEQRVTVRSVSIFSAECLATCQSVNLEIRLTGSACLRSLKTLPHRRIVGDRPPWCYGAAHRLVLVYVPHPSRQGEPYCALQRPSWSWL